MSDTKYYERTHYRFLSNTITIHVFIFLGLFALLGSIASSNYLPVCAALSFSGAVCGTSMRIKIAIEKKGL